jgi:parallel beta-helix repeat protein
LSNAPITYKANGAAVINSAESSGNGIYLSRVSWIVIDGFTIQNVSKRCIAAHDASATSPVTGLIIRSNTCTGASGGGFYLSQVSNSLVENNTIHDIGGSHGLYLANAGSDNTTLRRNTIHNIHGSDAAGIHMNGDRSIGGEGIISGVVLDGNTIYDVGFNGVSMDGVQNTTLQNNVIFRVAGRGVRAFRIDGGAGPQGLRFINNSIHSSRGWAIKISEDLGGHRIFNNVLLTDNSSSGSISIGTTTGFDSSNNAVVNRFSRNNESSTESLAQWQNSGFESNSFVTTPGAVFAAPSSNNYRLAAGSPAIDRGLASFSGVAAPSADRDGTARPRGAAFDIGAYEQ